MLTRFKAGDGFIYINPDQVFALAKQDDESTIIWSADEDNTAVVDEPLDLVAMRLNDAMRR
jgi:hypothetical protein